MLHIQGKISREVYLAFSGGVDSTAALDFLHRNHRVTLVHVNHGNDIAQFEELEAQRAAEKYRVDLIIYRGNSDVPSGKSREQHWRDQRYEFFHSLNKPVITCHHLDDCVETWVWNMTCGKAYTIPYQNGNVIRPFRLNRKQEFVNWCTRRSLTWFEDPTNNSADFALRNRIRHEVIPALLKVNPGLHTTVRNILLKEHIGQLAE